MGRFIAHYGSLVTGVLSGFDRLVFRGSLLPLIRKGGMYFFLEAAGIRLLDFKNFVTTTTERVKQASLAEARKLDRPICYLESPKINKEEFARVRAKALGQASHRPRAYLRFDVARALHELRVSPLQESRRARTPSPA